MSKKNTVIVINNRKYDAKTGAPLSPAHTPGDAPAKATKKRPARRTASHAPAHQPKPSKTLMRRAVHKPAVDDRRRVKVSTPIKAIATGGRKAPLVKSTSAAIVSKRLRRAKTIPKSQLITHFSSLVFSNSRDGASASAPTDNTPPSVTITNARSQAATSSRSAKPTTTAELLEYALQQATSHEQPPVEQKRHSLFRRRKQSATS